MLPSIIKLQKFFRLEAERGFDNKAVLGGLDKIIPIWEQEAQEQKIDPGLIQSVSSHLLSYPKKDPVQRSEMISEILDLFKESNKEASLTNGIKSYPSEDNQKPHPQIGILQSQSKPPLPPPLSNSVIKPNIISPVRTTSGLEAPLSVLTGIGPGNGKRLAEIGLNTLRDLLYYFPRRYVDYSKLKPIHQVTYGEELTIIGTIQSTTNRTIKNKQFQITEAVLSDGTGFLRLTWFNQPWIANRLVPGTPVSVSGKIDMYLGRYSMNNPDWELMEAEHLHTNGIVPVYSLTAGISQKWLRTRMAQTVKFWAPRVPDYMPENICQEAELVDLATALYQVHFPENNTQLQVARSRLAFDEIFFLQLGVLSQKKSWQSVTAQVFSVPDIWMDEQITHLPFTLTASQQKVTQEIRTDLASGHPMNRLLQGDVGSGKTVIAALAISLITHSGAQTALMAPTSILADQHYGSLQKLLAGESGCLKAEEIRLIIGDTPEAEKQQIREGLAEGTIKVIIGTHALIEDPVTFKRLQLAIIDEQHRFGVSQRAALRSKGENPHLLVMTATPIPRSLALTVYGDLDISVLDEMPAGRQTIDTHILHPIERERAYQVIRSQISQGYQAFVICPLVEKGEEEEVKAAIDEYNRLQKEIFPDLKLGLLYGRLKGEEKESVMTKFRNAEYDMLVSTSVVEVGVDVPNATVMLIEGANRFGLAQLHQFRGRVGRGQAKSMCILIPETEDNLENERLAVMTQTNDGFILAEQDLEQRGPGDFLGTRQSGFSDLRMANITDIRLIEKARHHAQAIFKQDPDLTDPNHEPLVRMMGRLWNPSKGDIS
jgi:ATP-dependent DNA helicase RecG